MSLFLLTVMATVILTLLWNRRVPPYICPDRLTLLMRCPEKVLNVPLPWLNYFVRVGPERVPPLSDEERTVLTLPPVRLYLIVIFAPTAASADEHSRCRICLIVRRISWSLLLNEHTRFAGSRGMDPPRVRTLPTVPVHLSPIRRVQVLACRCCRRACRVVPPLFPGTITLLSHAALLRAGHDCLMSRTVSWYVSVSS